MRNWRDRAWAKVLPRPSNLQRLLQLYMVILGIMVISVTVVATIVAINSFTSQVDQARTYARQRITSKLLQYQEITNDFASNLASDPSKVTSITAYFSLSVPDYANYTLEAADRSGRYYSWPQDSASFLSQHPEIQRLELVLQNNSHTHYAATHQQRSGRILPKPLVGKQDFIAPVIDYNFPQENSGTVGIVFDPAVLKAQLADIQTRAHMQILVVNDRGTLLNQLGDRSVGLGEKRAVRRAFDQQRLDRLSGYQVSILQLPNEYQMIVATNALNFRAVLIRRALPIIVLGLLVMMLLEVSLRITFRRYQRQLGQILVTVRQVSAGDMQARVPIVSPHSDLGELASGVNTMLEDIDQSISVIYKLQVAQQRANMLALRAQINPHFMSNTLEYIRMAALDADQPELAKVVYTFASLLRNNTDMAATATMAQELSFVEKYIYLYQVRFPDRLAYQVMIEPSLNRISMPKFSLQPIVENYFKHGVDFARMDNVISIKAQRLGGQIRILIRDNGKAMSKQELARLNLRMVEPLAEQQSQSIGLQNVYARLANYYGSSFHMRLQSNEMGGTTVVLTFAERGSEDEAGTSS